MTARASDSMFYPLTMCALQIVFMIMIIAVADLSVCVSVCLALTLCQTVEHIKLLSPPGKPASLAFWVKSMLQNSVGQTWWRSISG